MNDTILKLLIFLLSFGGMIIIHELGHFIAARLSKVEVEEFGIGLPTPGAITYWINKGFFFLRSGRRIEIPRNYRLPIAWGDLVGRDVKITVDTVDDRLVLRTIEWNKPSEEESKPVEGDVPQFQGVEENKPAEVIKFGKETGSMELVDRIKEVHPGTRFTINWLPLGGFVRPKGENDPAVEGGLAAANPWSRLFVLFAGPLMNLFMAFVIYSFIVSRVGAYDFNRVLITSVTPNGPAAQAGLREGDIFVSANGKAVHNYDEVSAIIGTSQDKPVDFVVDRNGQQVEVSATPVMNQQAGRALIGVGLSVPHMATGSFVDSVKWGATYTYKNVYTFISLPAQMIRGSIPAEQSRLVGLKGIYDIMGQSVDQGIQASQEAPTAQPFDWYIPVLDIIATLSISLGVLNLFPFPALDGGRIIFVIPELIFRKRVPARLENLVHGVGMTLLLLLMLYVNVMDFVNPAKFNIP